MVVKERTQSETVSKRLSELSEEKTSISSSLEKQVVKSKKLERENKTLKVNLQAKKEREAAESKRAEQARLASVATVEEPIKVNKPAPTVNVTGDKASWLAASGIPESDWAHVDSIVTRESGWNPNAVNKSSGACGLGQQLPCGKWAGAWNDPVAALTAMNGYVQGRYGSWAGAVAFWQANKWY